MNEPDWDIVDAIAEVLTDTPQTPSAIARRAKILTGSTVAPLRWMVANHYAIPVGNGAWTKYRQRRAGEALHKEVIT
jgi:hypothetical protein